MATPKVPKQTPNPTTSLGSNLEVLLCLHQFPNLAQITQDPYHRPVLHNGFVPTDPPDSAPSCAVLPANNYSDLALSCSWEGGVPPGSLKWTPYVFGDETEGMTNITKIQKGGETANNSVFVCQGSHIAQNEIKSCSVRTCKCNGRSLIMIGAPTW